MFYKTIIKIIINMSLRKAVSIIVQTNWMKDLLIKNTKLLENKISVIYPHTSFSISEKTKKYMNSYIYPTTPVPYKNIEVIINAVKNLLDNGVKTTVYITINGDENEYARKIKLLNNETKEYIKLIGRLNKNKLYEMYCANALIFPSYIETFGLPLLEARLSQSFIIASDMPFSREILNGYELASFFNPFSGIELSEKMIDYLKKINTCNMKNKYMDNSSIIESTFSPKNTWGKIIELIDSIIKVK